MSKVFVSPLEQQNDFEILEKVLTAAATVTEREKIFKKLTRIDETSQNCSIPQCEAPDTNVAVPARGQPSLPGAGPYHCRWQRAQSELVS